MKVVIRYLPTNNIVMCSDFYVIATGTSNKYEYEADSLVTFLLV